MQGGTAAATTALDPIQGQEGEAPGAAAFEQVDRPGGDAVVIHHHLAEAAAGGGVEGEAQPLLHLPELGHGTMQSLQTGFEQHPQGTGAPAFLKGLAAAVEAGDLPLQGALFLLQALAGALLQRQPFCQLAHRLLFRLEAGGEHVRIGLQPGQGLEDAVAVRGLLFGISLKLVQAEAVLPMTFLPFLSFLEQGRQGLLQGLPLLPSLALLLQPAAGPSGHIPEAAAGEVHGRFRVPAGLLRRLQGLIVGACLQFLLLTAQPRLALLQGLTTPLQGLGFPFVLLLLPQELPVAGLEAGQLRLHRDQLVFPQGPYLRLEGDQLSLGLAQDGLVDGDGIPFPLLPFGQGLLAFGQGVQVEASRLHRQALLLEPAEVELVAEQLIGAGLGAVAFEFLAGGEQFLLDDPTTLLAVLHLIELAAGLLDPGVEQGHPCELVDDASPIAGAHRDDPGDIALHDDVAALRVDPQAPELGLQLLQVAGHPVGAEAAAVGAPRGYPQPAAHGPFLLA